MLAKVRSRMGLWSGLLAAACVDNVTAPPLAVCNAAYQPLVLQVAQYRAIDPTLTQGCVIFPMNANPDSAEYLLVPQATTETPDLTSTFKLAGGMPALAAAQGTAAVQSYPLSPAERFHNMLRELERTRAYSSLVGEASSRPQAVSPVPAVISVGDQRTFTVLSNITKGSSGTPVTATVQSVGQHIALYVDNARPANGLTSTDFDALRDAFDQKLYPADTAAFGRESDIDGNGLVIVLMTNLVNKYVTASDCVASGYVAGFFLGADIDPSSAQLPNFNNGEVFYTMVADPAGTLSCPHSIAQVQRVVPGTLVHEFQHMISYNHHVLLQPAASQKAEVLWLNEALSHYAEELGGRTFLPGDSTSFCNYVSGDLYNAGQYLSAPGTYPLVDTAGLGALANRGEGWMFVRYLVDRFAQDTSLAAQNAVTRALDQGSVTSTANVAQVTGASFATTVGEWALANWVSDLPGFTAPDALKYEKWAFRSAFPALRAKCGSQLIPPTFPLVATAGTGPGINLSGTMVSGSGAAYQRALQAPGAASFTLLFSDATGAQLKATVVPRLNVLRIR